MITMLIIIGFLAIALFVMSNLIATRRLVPDLLNELQLRKISVDDKLAETEDSEEIQTVSLIEGEKEKQTIASFRKPRSFVHVNANRSIARPEKVYHERIHADTLKAGERFSNMEFARKASISGRGGQVGYRGDQRIRAGNEGVFNRRQRNKR